MIGHLFPHLRRTEAAPAVSPLPAPPLPLPVPERIGAADVPAHSEACYCPVTPWPPCWNCVRDGFAAKGGASHD